MANANSKWAIGIIRGSSPYQWQLQSDLSEPNLANPVLTADDVYDVVADFIADPFMINIDGRWSMFFEVLNAEVNRGEIGLATSKDGLSWSYVGIVLREPWHLSYPYIFEDKGRYYMLPEAAESGILTLYQAEDFPHQWKPIKTLLHQEVVDASPFYYQNHWWMLACTSPKKCDELALFHSDSLTGRWQKHPATPLVKANNRSARPAGRVIIHQGDIIRYAQDCGPCYGKQVRAFVIDKLSFTQVNQYQHSSSPILTPGYEQWNQSRMHHIDPHRLSASSWLACVDGDWRTS